MSRHNNESSLYLTSNFAYFCQSIEIYWSMRRAASHHLHRDQPIQRKEIDIFNTLM
jgi:hypothetical protein